MSWQPLASQSVLRERARLLRDIRDFLDSFGYLEVSTPLLSSSVNPDPALHPLSLAAEKPLHLQTSPEFAMKRLLASGSGSIYQVCPAFRDDEQGRYHHREFTMLEWYVEGFDYQRLMQQLEDMLQRLSDEPVVVMRISYCDLFFEHLSIDINQASLSELQQHCQQSAGYDDPGELSFQQCLDCLLAVCIEPAMRGFQFVYNYPETQSSLARPCADNPGYVERFELFHDGLELANGFSELTDPTLQRQRFDADNRRRQELGLPEYEPDQRLLAALQQGLPECAGVAVGLDRLLMVLLGLDHIDQVITFRD